MATLTTKSTTKGCVVLGKNRGKMLAKILNEQTIYLRTDKHD